MGAEAAQKLRRGTGLSRPPGSLAQRSLASMNLDNQVDGFVRAAPPCCLLT